MTATRAPARSPATTRRTGELVINLFGGDTVSGLVTDETEIRCGCKGTDDEYEDEDSADNASPRR